MIPNGWASCILSEIAEVRLGRQRSPKQEKGDHLRPYMRAANVTWQGMSLHDVKEMNFTPSEAVIYELKDGDILLSEASGSPSEVGKPAIWRNEVPGACFQNTLIRVRADNTLTRFLHLHFLRDVMTGTFARSSRGVGIHHLGAKAMSEWQVSLPPLGEQARLADALDSYLSRLDSAVAGLKRVQANLKRYRASVLKAAVEGRLVPTEAELARAEGRTYEPASELLARILKERRARWEANELASMKAKGKPPKDDKWKSQYKDPAPPNTKDLPKLPEGWCWATVDQLASVQGGIQKGKKREGNAQLFEVPYLRVANVQRGYLDLTEVKTIDATREEIDALELKTGDVLFNEGGDRDKLGRGWVWNGEVDGCIHQNHVFRARLYSMEMRPKFLSWYGNGSGQKYFFDEGKQTTNLASLNSTKLRSLPVPIPPAKEQLRIEAEMERLISETDASERTIELSVLRCSRLRQSILKWAFEGKLVDQDPNDEPASVLLARIRAEQEETAPAKKRPASTGAKQSRDPPTAGTAQSTPKRGLAKAKNAPPPEFDEHWEVSAE